MRFEVLAKPKAKKSRILGFGAHGLEVALAAPPVDGAANDELVRVLAEALGVPRRQVVLVRGQSSRRKLVEALGLTDDEVRARLEAASRE